MKVVEILDTMDYGPAPEDAGPALDWISGHNKTFGHFIYGEFASSAKGETFETTNPATGDVLAKVAQGSDADVDRAVQAAQEAQPNWWGIGPQARARYLYAIARQIQKHARLFATLETLDNGKPIRETRDLDIPLVARHFYHHAGWAQILHDQLPGYQPVGVCGQIIPWNFPLLMLAWKIAPALATGNTVVLKPAEYTPLTALLFAEICARTELPPGVVNIVTGDGTTGAALVSHPDVKKVAFTGSTEVGRLIRAQTAGTPKKLSLELGGKSPYIVFDDADLDSAVEGLVDAIWFNQGQVCCAGSRLIAQETIYGKLIEKIRQRMTTLRVGDPMDKAVDIGAIVHHVQLSRIQELVAVGVAEGSTLYQPALPLPNSGCFYPPTLFTDVAPAATIAQVEIFGPVLVAHSFRTPAEAVDLANNTPYGLAASVWSENISTALDMARNVLAGSVWINCTNQFDAASGFGGYRESGYGREGGIEGLLEYLIPPRVEPLSAAKAHLHSARPSGERSNTPAIDRTAKLYIGGKQVRPDQGYSQDVLSHDGRLLGEVAKGNRKDIRNAVEAARAARSWADQSAHARAQVLYFIAENLEARREEFQSRINDMTGLDGGDEVVRCLERTFHWAAFADKYDGLVHATNSRFVTLAMNEPIGVIGVVMPDQPPLLGFIEAILPAIAMGNQVVAVPSQCYPLACTDFYQVLETSDVPAGVVNIVTGDQVVLSRVLAEHDGVDSIWYFGSEDGARQVELLSAGNLKRTWVTTDSSIPNVTSKTWLYHATNVKNIWIPYGA